MTRRWETAIVAVGLALSGQVALAVAYSGTGTYEAIARGFAPATFHLRSESGARRDVRIDLPELVAYHRAWDAYVLAASDAPPPSSGGVEVFTPDEYAHLRDVRGLFTAFRVVAIVGAAAAAITVLAVRRRDPWAAVRLARDAAIAAGAAVLALAAVAAVAFDPLFLLFHEVFFPQGNFLFPGDSNLLALYPDEYWSGVTLRVGLTLVALVAAIALAATATLRRSRR